MAFSKAFSNSLGGGADATGTGPVYANEPGVDVNRLIILPRGPSPRYRRSGSRTPGHGRSSRSSANSAQDCPTHRRKDSCACTIDTADPPVPVTSTRMAWVSPASPGGDADFRRRSVAFTIGREKSARSLLNRLDRHSPLGTIATSSPSMKFHASGAVPMAADDPPRTPSSAGTVAASGNGQAKTVLSPTRDLASSLPYPTADDGYWAIASPNPRLVMYRLTSPLPPNPAVK